MLLKRKIQSTVKHYIFLSLFFICFLSCSTQKNKALNKGYHSVVSSYNVLFNGETSIDEGFLQTQESFVDNFWEILPVEKINISKVMFSASLFFVDIYDPKFFANIGNISISINFSQV